MLNRSDSILLTNVGEYFYRTRAGQTTGRKRDLFFLRSMLFADLRILDMIPPNFSTVRKVVQKRMFSTFIELSGMENDVHISRQVYKSMYLMSISSIRMAIYKFLGPKVYHLLFKKLLKSLTQ